MVITPVLNFLLEAFFLNISGFDKYLAGCAREETHLLKLQRLQNTVLRTIGNFPRRTSVRDIHVAFQIPYVYDYIIKSCRPW
jgi:hypothetical protein